MRASNERLLQRDDTERDTAIMPIPELSNLTRHAAYGVAYADAPDHQHIVLSREDVDEFRAIVREVSGEEMSEQAAWNRATAVSALARMLVEPIPEDPGRRSS
jgi:hypothetical protein